jgi:glycosyltransferase involved in cell wall biosynthesis
MAHLILAVTNDLASDQRMHRIATTLRQAGHEVTLVGRQLPDSPPAGDRTYATHRFRLFFSKGKLFYLEYNWRLFWHLLRRRPDLITANDLDTLLAGYLASRLLGRPLVYDSHEYFTEVPELIHRPLTRRIWLALERWIFPKLTHVYTVSESIRAVYADTYGVKVELVRNLPFRRPAPELAEKPPLLMYQGALNVGRGLELMIAALVYLPEYRLAIAGRGDIAHQLAGIARTHGVAERVTLIGHLAPDELARHTARARYGLSLEEDLGANYRFALPNKVFDYIQARVPVIVSDLPEMRSVVENWGVGTILDSEARTPQGLAAHIRAMEASGKYQKWVTAADRAAVTLCWEQEEKTLLDVYHQALRRN